METKTKKEKKTKELKLSANKILSKNLKELKELLNDKEEYAIR